MRRAQQLDNGSVIKTVVPENKLASGLAGAGDFVGGSIGKVGKSRAFWYTLLGAGVATGGAISGVAGILDGGRQTVSGTREGISEGINRVTNGEGLDINLRAPGVDIGDNQVGGQTLNITPSGDAAGAAPAESAGGLLIPTNLLAQGPGAIIRFCGVEPAYGDPSTLQAQWVPIASANSDIWNSDVNNPGLNPGEQGRCPA